MDALQISGKWYISTRRAAKEHGYHADYIGQLIRSGKVKGQKVGRSWYALADSLTEYLETEKKSQNSVLGRRKQSKAKNSPPAEEAAQPEILAEKVNEEPAQEIVESFTKEVVVESEVKGGDEAQRSVHVHAVETAERTAVQEPLIPITPPLHIPTIASIQAHDRTLLTYLKEEEAADMRRDLMENRVHLRTGRTIAPTVVQTAPVPSMEREIHTLAHVTVEAKKVIPMKMKARRRSGSIFPLVLVLASGVAVFFIAAFISEMYF